MTEEKPKEDAPKEDKPKEEKKKQDPAESVGLGKLIFSIFIISIII